MHSICYLHYAQKYTFFIGGTFIVLAEAILDVTSPHRPFDLTGLIEVIHNYF